MTVDQLAEALLALAQPSCRDDRCGCSERRERFECVLGESPEGLAKDILSRVGEFVENGDEAAANDRLRAILLNVALALGCEDSLTFRKHIGFHHDGESVEKTATAEKHEHNQ